MPSINDYRRRSARSEMELKAILKDSFVELWHLSPEDSPDLMGETRWGDFVFIEAKAITKTNFDCHRDPDTEAQHERLDKIARRSHDVWYAIKFTRRGWRFYRLPWDRRSMPETEGRPLVDFLAYARDHYAPLKTDGERR